MADISTVVQQKVSSAVVSTIAKPEVDANMTAASEIVEAVVNNILPTILNATNSEPWYQSRILWGQFVVILGIVLGLFGVTISAGVQTLIVTLGVSLVGAGITIYGRIRAAKKPIGS